MIRMDFGRCLADSEKYKMCLLLLGFTKLYEVIDFYTTCSSAVQCSAVQCKKEQAKQASKCKSAVVSDKMRLFWNRIR